jgi:exopolysaccharide biosynthesis polyprenyl glycosylphosphotransferase
MASSEFWTTTRTSAVNTQARTPHALAGSCDVVKVWMIWDALTAMIAAPVAVLIRFPVGIKAGAKDFWDGTLIHTPSVGLLLAILAGFILVLLATSQRFHLYSPRLLGSFLFEQRLTFQACIVAGLLLSGSLYVLHASQVPREVVFLTIAMVTVGISLRRMLFRLNHYRKLERGIGTRSLLIVGTGPEAQDLRRHLESVRHFGFVCKGFIVPDGAGSSADSDPEVVGNLDTMFDYARRNFVDEILVATPVDSGQIREMLFTAHEIGVDLRLVPEQFGGLTMNSPIEYIGQFPTIPLHRSDLREFEQTLKRGLDIVLSSAVLLVLSPVMAAIAIIIKTSSPGPVFYRSERLGKKGRIFRCIKFRSMVNDAERQRLELAQHNERDGILFKMTKDPRVTKVGRILRKYSLDELPQFVNVLKGEMSIVGPRPPMGTEVQQYKLHHLRRLNATPGITGLWQVQARQDPSFDNYISLDLAYIEHWSIWLDLKIIVRTIAVVVAGTGC